MKQRRHRDEDENDDENNDDGTAAKKKNKKEKSGREGWLPPRVAVVGRYRRGGKNNNALGMGSYLRETHVPRCGRMKAR